MWGWSSSIGKGHVQMKIDSILYSGYIINCIYNTIYNTPLFIALRSL